MVYENKLQTLNEQVEALLDESSCPPTKMSNDLSDNLLQKDTKKIGGFLKQILAAFLASLSSVSIGFITAYSSLTLPQLRNETSLNFDDVRDSGWVASLPSISSLAGSLAGGLLMEAIGPRMCLLTTVIPCIFSWSLIAFANSVALIYIGRFLTGIFLGIYSPVPQVYAIEIAEPKIRGFLGAIPEAAVAMGSLLCYVFGAMMDWRHLAVIAALLPGIPLFISTLLLPESPQWLIKKNKLMEAQKSLRFFRGKAYDIQSELKLIRDNILEKEGYDISLVQQLRLFKKVHNWKPVFMVFLVFMCGQFSGFAVVTAYTADIFISANTGLDAYMSTIIVGLLRFLATILSAVLLDKVGRRPLVVISALGSAAGMFTIGLFFYLKSYYGDVEELKLMPLTSLLIYVFFNELGYGPIPWLLSGEMIPLAVRAIGNGVAVTAYSLFAFLIGLTFPYLTEAISNHCTFFLYSAFSLSGIVLVFYLPETRGKSLEEIERCFYSKSLQKSRNNS